MHQGQELLHSVREGSQELALTWQAEGALLGFWRRAVLRRPPSTEAVFRLLSSPQTSLAVLPWAGEAKLPWGSVLCCAQLCSAVCFILLNVVSSIFAWLQVVLEVRRKLPTLKIQSRSSPCAQLVLIFSSLPHAGGEHDLLWNEKLCVIDLMFVFPSPIWLVHTRGCTLWNWL